MANTPTAVLQSQPGASVLAAWPQTPQGGAQNLDLLQILGKGNAVLARVNSAGAVIGGSTSSDVLTQVTVGTLALTAAAVASFTLTSVVGATGVYSGTITGGAANAFAGKQVIIAGFATSGNNGTFTITASTATTITVVNGSAADETHAGTAQVSGVSLATYSGTLTGGGSNAFAGKQVIIAGFAANTGGNNGTFTIISSTTTTLVVLSTDTTVAETHAGTAQIAGVSQTTYTGTITGGNANALAGQIASFTGFAASAGVNNVSNATILSSTLTTLVVLTTVQVNETHAGAAALTISGTNGTRVGVFQTNLDATATIAQLFANAFFNPALLDILQVVNEGGNVSYYLDYLGVAHGS